MRLLILSMLWIGLILLMNTPVLLMGDVLSTGEDLLFMDNGNKHVAEQDSVNTRPAEVFPATKDYQGPDFELIDENGETVRLSDYRGKVVLLNIWATWCPPCREEVPALVRLQEEYGADGLQIIGVSIDENGAGEAVSEFAGSFDINYPVPVDDGVVQEKYGPLSVIPTSYFLDREGYIRFYAPGYLEYEQMEETVRKLLNL